MAACLPSSDLPATPLFGLHAAHLDGVEGLGRHRALDLLKVNRAVLVPVHLRHQAVQLRGAVVLEPQVDGSQSLKGSSDVSFPLIDHSICGRTNVVSSHLLGFFGVQVARAVGVEQGEDVTQLLLLCIGIHQRG